MKLKRIKQLAMTLSLALAASVVPTMASEVVVPEVSSWAIWELNEGEKYGIFPLDWYYDGFQDAISQDKLVILLDGVNQKLVTLGVEPIGDMGYGVEGQTRGDVINSLYSVLIQYDIPSIDLEESALDYFVKRGLINGYDDGLSLEEPATVEEAALFATRIVRDTYDLLEEGAKGFMWQVQNKDVTMYLLGSIHSGTYDMYPMNKEVLEAFYSSDALLVEANVAEITEEDMMLMQTMMLYQDGETLQENISEEVFEKLVQVGEEVGIPIELLNMYKPWSLAVDLTQLAVADVDSQEDAILASLLAIDPYFMTLAMLTQKPIGELESIVYQLELFDGLDEDFQEFYLDAVLESILNPEESGEAEMLASWQEYWVEGDVESFKASYGQSVSDDRLSVLLFGERDQHMATQLIEILEQDIQATYFVVVGAGHYTVEGTVIDILEEAGYTVEWFYE